VHVIPVFKACYELKTMLGAPTYPCYAHVIRHNIQLTYIFGGQAQVGIRPLVIARTAIGWWYIYRVGDRASPHFRSWQWHYGGNEGMQCVFVVVVVNSGWE
jgi:hypothetical protein